MVVGIGIAAVRRRVEDPVTEVTISLLTAYAAYLPAEELGASGVLAAVTVGIWLGWQASELTTHTTRIQLFAVWEVLQFLLNAFLFVLIGLQLPNVLDDLSGRPAGELAAYGALISIVVIAVRMAWVYALAALPRRLSPLTGKSGPAPWRNVRLSPGAACAAASRSPPPWRSRWRSTAARPSPSATWSSSWRSA